MSKTLVKVLRNAKSLNDFMILLNALCENKLKPDNIAFLLCLERAKYAYCDNGKNELSPNDNKVLESSVQTA